MGTSCFGIDEKTDTPRQKEMINKAKEDRKKESNKKTTSESSSKKLYNSIVLIKYEKESISTTGFFLKLILFNETRNYLITLYHEFNEKFIQDKQSIKLYYGPIKEEKNIEIKLDQSKRDIKCLKAPLYVTLIEILKEDKISEDNFLLPDTNYKKEGYNSYINKNNYYYLPGYTTNNERLITHGKITETLEKPEFKHSFENVDYNSGAPICSEDNLLVIGIHKKNDNSKKINYGIFFGYILEHLEKEGKNKENKSSLFENIQSRKIIRKIFYYLDEKIKLKTIKYNNMMKNLNQININNYKFFTNKYIEYDTNIKGKEYNYNGELIFEGEYLNGERNGKGKEYNVFRKLKFEGEYLNGKRNGKGKEYHFDGKLEFEGEYLNGKRWNGKGYNKNNDIIYILKNGNGSIKEFDFFGLEFEGEYLNGERNGKGKEYYFDGKLKFEGEYLNGKRWNGKRYNKSNDIVYVLKNGKGSIKEYNDDGKLKFEGE